MDRSPEQSLSKVRLLDPALANQIAAGEVVERPASVVKELLENALDAGAKAIVVEFSEGGLGLIRVTDDGNGMSAEDAAMSVKRHATSKLRRIEDLQTMTTLGFRGEAVPSIASVSRFTLRTRTREDNTATIVQLEGNADATVSPGASAVGTTVEARELFFNVPARKKFLRSTNTEAAHITEVCTRVALVHPNLKLTVIRDGRVAREFLPTSSAEDRVAMIFDNETLRAFSGEGEGAKVKAYVSSPERARTGMTALHLFVNGRPVRDRALGRAVALAYGDALPSGKYPAGVVFVEVPPAEVDVNVHPQKAEVRFARSREVFESVMHVLSGGLMNADWTTTRGKQGSASTNQTSTGLRSPSAYVPRARSFSSLRDRGTTSDWVTTTKLLLEPPRPTVQHQQAKAARWSELRVIGVARGMYVLCESRDEVCVLDLHALDERVRFQRMQDAHVAGNLASQSLLFAERLECEPAEVSCVERHIDTLSSLGFEVSTLGEHSLALRGVPAAAARAPAARLFLDALAILKSEAPLAQQVMSMLATLACHGSLRAGDTATPDEVANLLRAMDAIDETTAPCLHGQPLLHALPFADLEARARR